MGVSHSWEEAKGADCWHHMLASQPCIQQSAEALSSTAVLQKRIKSITVTGHSLGGALAGVCGYDLSTTIKQALTTPATREAFSKADQVMISSHNRHLPSANTGVDTNAVRCVPLLVHGRPCTKNCRRSVSRCTA